MPEFKKSNGFKLKSGNKTSFKSMGSSPLKKDTGYSEKKKNHQRSKLAEMLVKQ